MKNAISILIFAVMVFTIGLQTGFSQNKNQEYIKGAINLEKGNTLEGIEILQNCISTGKNSDLAHLCLGKKYLKEKDFEKAKYHFYSANKANSSIASFDLARTFSLLNMPDSAVIMLEEHLNSQFKLTRPTITLNKDFSNIENTKQWRSLWEKPWYSEKETLLTEAEGLINNKSFESALVILDEYLANKKDHYAQFLRAKVFYSLQNTYNAIKDLDDAIKARPGQSDYYKTRGEIFFSE
ncbi:MAG: hypothetical protein JXR58_04300, partial [Bacteroidales bacterium]|nr:hypothetical protein [Bacteroidales bacterium]